MLAAGHAGTSCPTVPVFDGDGSTRASWMDVDFDWTPDPIDPTAEDLTDTAACWLGRAIWAAIIVGGLALGAGLAAGAGAVHRRVTR